MPAKDSISHRGASAVRNARRFAPYQCADGNGAAPHASHSSRSLRPQPTQLIISSPQETTLIPQSVLSSTATLTSSSFVPPSDKCDTPESYASDKHIYASGSGRSKSLCSKSQVVLCVRQQKLAYLTSLMDYASKVLEDNWPEQDIPAVFRYTNGASFGYTPSTVGISVDCYRAPNRPSDVVKMKTFVYELVRRSRTTCTTLQAALCYIEAIRTRIPELQKAERDGSGIRGEQVDNEGRIEIEVPDVPGPPEIIDASKPHPRKCPSLPTIPLPPLPSALLCPRRSFMAALVLAAKFVQDKCYSNRAWSKLSGLPPREVSRCERALGEALEWRLWVGKECGFNFAGLDSPLGKEPSFAQIFVEDDRKDSFSISAHPRPLMAHPTELITMPLPTSFEALTISPTPSLVSSASYLSSGSSQGIPTPQSTFVSNDLCSSPGHLPKQGDYHASYYSGGDATVQVHSEQDIFGIRACHRDADF